jgi:hypothetical protein
MRPALYQTHTPRPSKAKFLAGCLSLLSLAAVGFLFAGSAAQATTVSPNTGGLGSAANGTNADSVTFGPGAVTAGGDRSAVYDGLSNNSNTSVPFQSGLNPTAASSFTIEFWARPTASDNDDAPVSNRLAAGVTNRSGWVFFQRAAGAGWNFRMYSGDGSTLGWDLTGGSAPLNAWSHVVATWDGSAARLYVNGSLADNTNDPAATGVYNPNTSTASFLVATSDSGSPYTGSVDEVAFYPTVLSGVQILSHFNTVSSPTANAYQDLVRSDGARLQLSNNPEPSSMMLLLGVGSLALFRRRAASR